MSNLNEKKKRVVVGISGGVDSAVSAMLLLQQGYEVEGVFMQCWDAKADGCRVEEDQKYAVETAATLGIKITHLDFRTEYKNAVIEYFYKEYSEGRTPNPDIMCNKEIKFGLFFDWAMRQGYDYIATGHYARIENDASGNHLLKGIDSTKDQSYFLYNLHQYQLGQILFPVGSMEKSLIRKLALENNLPPATRPDSVGICFIGEVDIREFLKKRMPETPGDVLFINNEVVGRHVGACFYTIGQRHGFSISKYFGKPLYVISKDVSKNEIMVGFEQDCYNSTFNISDMHWVCGDKLLTQKELKCDVRIRHLGKMNPATVTLEDRCFYKVVLENPAFAVAPGQSAVLYFEDELLGGGIIV